MNKSIFIQHEAGICWDSQMEALIIYAMILAIFIALGLHRMDEKRKKGKT